MYAEIKKIKDGRIIYFFIHQFSGVGTYIWTDKKKSHETSEFQNAGMSNRKR